MSNKNIEKNSNGAGECIFCKIINKQIPSTNIYEDDTFLVFIDIFPVSKGHILIVPKEHYVWMQETSDEVITKAYLLAKKLMLAMKTGLPCDFVQLSVVGKDVPHFHIHLMPRYMDDNIQRTPTIKYESDAEIGTYAEKIKRAIYAINK